ncbi:MAG: lysylphosphatidylglycerol synthase transmembrane domain-containing protein [Acidimicrobiia bacterium]
MADDSSNPLAESSPGFRRRILARLPDGASRRRPGDAVRVVVALVVLAALSFHAFHPNSFERDLVDWVQSLPDGAARVVRFFYNLLALWAVGIVATAMCFVRRWRLARDLTLAALLAWVGGRVLAFFVHQTDLAHAFKLTIDLTDAPRFPLVRVAIAVAVVTVASPYLARPTRRVGQVLVVLLGLAGMYLGRALLTDVIGAFVLGWGAAAAVHFAFGTPARRPAAWDVGRALAQLGLPAQNVRAAPEQPVGRAVFLADGADGSLRVIALGRDEADAQFLSRMWRWIAYRDAPSVFVATRRRQVEFETFVMLLAAEFGARVPQVVKTGRHGALALLAMTEVEGQPLRELDADARARAVLEDAWTQTERIHAAGLAHGRLDADHLVVQGTEVTAVGWERATSNAGDRQRDDDVAQLLASTAAAAGNELAVEVALAHVGREVLVRALPLLQPNALAWVTRDALDARGDHALDDLRDAAAAATDTEPPELRERFRVNPRQLLMAVGALFAVAILLSRVGDPVEFWDSIHNANWWYVALAFVLGIATDVAFAVAFLGTVPVRIGLWPSILLQSSMSFSNLAVPVAADTAIQIRFLQKNGLDVASAVATGGVLSTITELVVQAGLFVVALWLAPDSIDFGRIDTNQIVVVVLAAVFLLGVAAAIVFSVRRVRRAVLPRFIQAAKSMATTLASPQRIALLVVGNVSAQCLYAASLLSCLAAFGASVNFWTLLAINIGITLIASLVPFPGGGTAVSAVGISGLLTALGVPVAAASAAVIAHQLAVSYLPAIPGWFATNDLVKKRML